MMQPGELMLDDIVGQSEATSELKSLVNKIKFKEVYDNWGVKPPKGILLSGEPGVGKTESVRALARELGDSVVVAELRYIEMASKFVDAPVENMRNFFDKVEQLSETKHVILFVDEIDSMIPSRDGELHETSVKRVDVFLEWMDGGLKKRSTNVTVIGATNHIEGVDKAARRPGRFDKIVNFVPLEKKHMIEGIKIHLSKRNLHQRLIENIKFEELEQQLMDGVLVGADLPEIVTRVLTRKAEEQIAAINPDSDFALQLKKLTTTITTQDFVDEVISYQNYKMKTDKKLRTSKVGFL